MAIFYKKWKKYNEIQLTKYKIFLNNRKMKDHPSSHVFLVLLVCVIIIQEYYHIISTIHSGPYTRLYNKQTNTQKLYYMMISINNEMQRRLHTTYGVRITLSKEEKRKEKEKMFIQIKNI